MRKIALLIVCMAAIVAGYYLLSPHSSTSEKETGTQKGTTSNLSLSPKMSAPKVMGPAPAPVNNEFQRLLDNLWAASLTPDHKGVPEARKKLAAYLEAHPEAMSDLLAIYKAETDEHKFSVLTPLLTDYENPEGRRLITQAALDLAQHDPSSSKRQASVTFLTKATPVDQECLQVIAQVAKTDASDLVRITAIDIMNVWLMENPGRVEQLLSGLSEAIQSSTDDRVRGRALQVLAQQNAQLPEAILKNVAPALTTTSSDNRVAAVMVLGQAADDAKGYALNELESAFRKEASEPVKRDILAQLVRVGKAQATPILQRLSKDLGLDPDMIDFLKIIQEGKTTSIDEIYQQKFTLESARAGVATTTEKP